MALWKIVGDKDKNISLSEYLDEVCPYLVKFINKIKETNKARETQISRKIIFSFSKGNDDEKEMYLKSTTIVVKAGKATENLIDVICKSMLSNYQEDVMGKMEISYFVFAFIDRIFYSSQQFLRLY